MREEHKMPGINLMDVPLNLVLLNGNSHVGLESVLDGHDRGKVGNGSVKSVIDYVLGHYRRDHKSQRREPEIRQKIGSGNYDVQVGDMQYKVRKATRRDPSTDETHVAFNDARHFPPIVKEKGRLPFRLGEIRIHDPDPKVLGNESYIHY